MLITVCTQRKKCMVPQKKPKTKTQKNKPKVSFLLARMFYRMSRKKERIQHINSHMP